MNDLPPLHWLRSFVVSARLLSFTQASAKLSLTQAAISKHIKGLESWLGLQLFIREAHGLSLTEQGRRYYKSSEPLLNQLDQLTFQVARRSQRDRLRLRCNISFSTLVLPTKLAALRALLPDIEIDINNGIFEPEKPSENAHLEIGYAPRAKLKSNHSLKVLTDDTIFPVVAPHITPEQMLALPLLSVTGYSGEWQWWLSQQTRKPRNKRVGQWLESCQISSKKTLRSDNSLTVYQMCTQGLGVAMARRSFVEPLLDNGQLQTIKQTKPLPAPDLFFARLSTRGMHHHAAEVLFKLL